MLSKVRLIFISCVASENSRRLAFEGPCMCVGGRMSVLGGGGGTGFDQADLQRIQ